MTRVLIVDDHPVFRNGMRSLLEASGIDVVGEAATGAQAIDLAARSNPDVVLMDLGLPDMSGVEATGRIVAGRPAARVLVVSLYQDDGSVEQAIRAGARGYVVKDAPADEVIAAVQAVASGSAVIGGSLVDRLATLVHARAGDVREGDFPSLTSRERQVLALVANGMSNAAIAERLGLSGKTVANYVSVVLAKLEVTDRHQAKEKVSRATETDPIGTDGHASSGTG
jgi:DNA-binding NarL/FixJ family response regulator